KQYMAEDDTTLPKTIAVTVHGCGEFFPVDASGRQLDANPSDDQEDATDRRVELFFFNGKAGIQPPVPGPNSKQGSTEYPQWRKRAEPRGEWTVRLSGIAAVRGASRFTRASTFPKPSLIPATRKVVTLLRANALLNVEIVGHSDNKVEQEIGVELAKARAEAVASWLK